MSSTKDLLGKISRQILFHLRCVEVGSWESGVGSQESGVRSPQFTVSFVTCWQSLSRYAHKRIVVHLTVLLRPCIDCSTPIKLLFVAAY